MDLINIPADIIVEPVRLTTAVPKTIKFEVNPKIIDLICSKNSNYHIELRGLRLSNTGFKNSWPNFGNFGLNGADWNHAFTLPEREQSRKRKDDPIDLTVYFKSRAKKTHVLLLKKNRTPPKQEKNEDPHHYAIGLFLVRRLDINQIVEYHKKYAFESFINTYKMISQRLFPNKEDDVHVISDNLKVPMRCPITLSQVQIPAKGYQCAHVEVSESILISVVI
jgi:hypothetical protein